MRDGPDPPRLADQADDRHSHDHGPDGTEGATGQFVSAKPKPHQEPDEGDDVASATSFDGYAASEWLSDHVDLTKPFRRAGSKMSEKISELRHNGLRNPFDNDASYASQTQGRGDIRVPSGNAQAPSIDAGGNGIGSDSAKNALHDYIDAYQKDFTITKGEGMFHQMDEMGIPEDIQRKVMEDVGPKWDGKWTYATGDNWGWSHTGTMPDQLVKDIYDAAKDHGYDTSKVIEHAHEKPHLIKRGDGVISLVNREYGVPLSPSQAHELANGLQGDGSKMVYDSSYLKQHFGVEEGILPNHGAIADADNHFIINYLKDHHLIENVPSSTMTEATNTTVPIDNLPNPHDLFGITAAKQDNASLTELQTTYRDFVTDLKAGQYAKINSNDKLQAIMKYFYKDVGATKYMQSDTLIFNEAANGTITVNPLPKSAALPNSIKSLIVSYDQTFFTEAA